MTEQAARQVTDRLLATDFEAWSEALARVGNCAHPIRLSGHSQTVDTITGEIVAGYSSSQEPLGVTHVRCGTGALRSARRVPGSTPATCST